MIGIRYVGGPLDGTAAPLNPGEQPRFRGDDGSVVRANRGESMIKGTRRRAPSGYELVRLGNDRVYAHALTPST